MIAPRSITILENKLSEAAIGARIGDGSFVRILSARDLRSEGQLSPIGVWGLGSALGWELPLDIKATKVGFGP